MRDGLHMELVEEMEEMAPWHLACDTRGLASRTFDGNLRRVKDQPILSPTLSNVLLLEAKASQSISEKYAFEISAVRNKIDPRRCS